MQALVSIIIPCFNREDLLPETLDSVLDQTYSNWECIIVDDHSTDSTPQVGKEYAAGDEEDHFPREDLRKIPGVRLPAGMWDWKMLREILYNSLIQMTYCILKNWKDT